MRPLVVCEGEVEVAEMVLEGPAVLHLLVEAGRALRTHGSMRRFGDLPVKLGRCFQSWCSFFARHLGRSRSLRGTPRRLASRELVRGTESEILLLST